GAHGRQLRLGQRPADPLRPRRDAAGRTAGGALAERPGRGLQGRAGGDLHDVARGERSRGTLIRTLPALLLLGLLAAPAAPPVPAIPAVDTSAMEPAVRAQLDAARRSLEEAIQ